MSLITLTTDFGSDSPYVAQMKGSIYGLAPQANVVDVTHSIAAQDIQYGALVLADSAFCFPQGTIHVAVVDPGVGTERAIVAARIDGQWFVAPDNGLLTGVAKGRNCTVLRRVENEKLWRVPVANTFHGRDIIAPVAAHLHLGIAPEEIGPPQTELQRIAWPTCELDGDQIIGEVVSVDSFGNLITNIFHADVANWLQGRACEIRIAAHGLNVIRQTYGQGPPGELIALFGSSQRMEIAIVHGSASTQLGVGRGETVTLSVA